MNPASHSPHLLHAPHTPKIEEAVQARDALATALSQAGIQLPAMDIRTPWADDRKAEAQYALVHLGVCSAPIALLLADVITKGLSG
ncbi:hypothetical protein [Streptomyces longispororuber]|uniref:hypothetical protein n=1 Tax=Streptomyces longispororuber TaxID=68230 RepID=UPI00210B4301|nr:hypothetical protein [Streptomyces longispororuber]MCQ4207774.1 hypothetical protein [Streptomyces longispororuber]